MTDIAQFKGICFSITQTHFARIETLREQNGNVNRSRVLNAALAIGIAQLEAQTQKNPN